MLPESVIRFEKEYKRLSNFYPVDIQYNVLTFPTVEHAYAASKSKDPMFWYNISKIPSHQAGKAKRLARKTKLRRDWEIVKISLMRRFLIQKFNYPEFRDFLLSTKDAILIEGNHWHDNYWGDCFCPKCKSIEGQNQLGKLLMNIRGTL